ncbi:MAG: prepilin peptidase [Stappiaceae bacterium]
MYEIAVLTLFPLLAVLAAVTDLARMTIPNWLSMGLIAGFAILAPFSGMDMTLAGWHIATGLGLLVVTFSLFSMGWIGGGDAKYAAAIALWFGWPATLEFLLISALFGGALTIAIVAFRKMPLPQLAYNQEWITRLHDPKNGAPYGVALSCGALYVFPNTVWMSTIL